jgi:transposase-like protein
MIAEKWCVDETADKIAFDVAWLFALIAQKSATTFARIAKKRRATI